MRQHQRESVHESRFAAPSGIVGRLAGHVMARLTAEANHLMVDLLDVQAEDLFLDSGCGSGVAVAAAAARAQRGHVAGVDISATMVRQARRRNRTGIRAGRVAIVQADTQYLPVADGRRTKVGSLNSIQFWTSPEQGFRELHRVLTPGGRAALVVMARTTDPPLSGQGPGDSRPPWLDETALVMTNAGFADLTWKRREFGGVLHWAILGHRPV